MGVSAKICGITTPEAVRAALEGGAAYLGFMFFEKSPRNIAPDAAARLVAPVQGRAKVVAVVVDAGDPELDRIVSILKTDLLQLHGKESPARVRENVSRTGLGVVKELPVAETADIAAAAAYEPLVEHLMF